MRSHGYARLRILKDREGELTVGDTWPLVYSREHGFQIDRKEEETNDQIEQRILAAAGKGALLTVEEWGKDLVVGEKKAKKILEGLLATGRIHLVVGPPGRSSRARCYGTPLALWAE